MNFAGSSFLSFSMKTFRSAKQLEVHTQILATYNSSIADMLRRGNVYYTLQNSHLSKILCLSITLLRNFGRYLRKSYCLFTILEKIYCTLHSKFEKKMGLKIFFFKLKICWCQDYFREIIFLHFFVNIFESNLDDNIWMLLT